MEYKIGKFLSIYAFLLMIIHLQSGALLEEFTENEKGTAERIIWHDYRCQTLQPPIIRDMTSMELQ